MQIHEPCYLIQGGTKNPLLPHLLRAIDSATAIYLAVSFTRLSGLRLITESLEDAIGRGVPMQFLTSDYLDVTEPDALRRLMLLKDIGASVKVHACEQSGSFHPKAYIFIQNGSTNGVAFVGSSNLSESALVWGVEWNLCIDSRQTPAAFDQTFQAFKQLFDSSKAIELTWGWIERYEQRRKIPVLDIDEMPQKLPKPHPIQLRALEALSNCRLAGMQRALVVMATGVGKTWLAVFDILQGGYHRVLFIAHREEILNQAAQTFQMVLPSAKAGFYHGGEKSLDSDILFGSVQSLGNKKHLRQFARDAFDYIVIDEFHHASAASYQNILNYFTPAFLLGLTATPERTDGKDIEALCDNNLIFRFDITEAIESGHLCPFTYYGIHDRHVNYETISWRNQRFETTDLEKALDTVERAEHIFAEWQGKGLLRTLGFCVSINHADFMAGFFISKGVRAAAVHSRSALRRHEALERLTNGTLQVIFCVDLFNEGLDIPSIDTVLMIRTTESPVVYLQQLGRGLRCHDKKERLVVLDFIGNHRSFLLGPQVFLGLRPGTPRFSDQLKAFQRKVFPLPAGCEVNFDLEVIDLLQRLTRINRNPDQVYEYLRQLNGRRPTAIEMTHYGISFQLIRRAYGSWVHMIHAMGDLDPEIFKNLFSHIEFFREMEKTSLTKCFKLITLEAMIELDGFADAPATEVLADKSLAVLVRRPVLLADIHERFPTVEQIRTTMPDQWHQYWLDNPLNALTGGNLKGSKEGKVFFAVKDGRFIYHSPVADSVAEHFNVLLQEIINCRLVGYNPAVQETQVVVCKLFNRGTSPIIKLNDTLRKSLPKGKSQVLIDGQTCEAVFAKIAVNVIKDSSGTNIITEILRRWFGDRAGMPGEMHQVRFIQRDGMWSLEPVVIEKSLGLESVAHQSEQGSLNREAATGEATTNIHQFLVQEPPVEERYRPFVPYYTFKAAAGKFGLDPSDSLSAKPKGWVPIADAKPDMFILQAVGKSMEPIIPDGALCLFRAGTALGGTRNGRVVLVQCSGLNDSDTESSLTIKRYFSKKTGSFEEGGKHIEIQLVPANRDFETIFLTPENPEEFKIIAEFVRVLKEQDFILQPQSN